MSDAIRVCFTGDCDGFAALRKALVEHGDIEPVADGAEIAHVRAALVGGHLDCVVHATREARFPGDEIALIREHTRAPIILVAAGGEAASMLDQALAADVSDVLLLPQLTHNVLFAIRKAAHARRQVEMPATKTGRVITVFSPKGGTGKTAVATNLAAALVKREGKRTLLLDLDLQFGDAAISLGIEPDKTIYDLVVAPGELDPEKLAGYVTRHPSGLDILAAPLRPEDAELVVESKVTNLIEVARISYEAIVVDTSPFFHGPMLATLDRTDELLILCGLDVPTLKNVRLALQTLELLSFPASRIRYVMNRGNSDVGLKTKEVETALGVKIACEIPTDRAVPVAVNRGEPVVISEPRCEFAKAIATLTKQVAPQTSDEKRKQRWALSLARA